MLETRSEGEGGREGAVKMQRKKDGGGTLEELTSSPPVQLFGSRSEEEEKGRGRD